MGESDALLQSLIPQQLLRLNVTMLFHLQSILSFNLFPMFTFELSPFLTKVEKTAIIVARSLKLNDMEIAYKPSYPMESKPEEHIRSLVVQVVYLTIGINLEGYRPHLHGKQLSQAPVNCLPVVGERFC